MEFGVKQAGPFPTASSQRKSTCMLVVVPNLESEPNNGYFLGVVGGND